MARISSLPGDDQITHEGRRSRAVPGGHRAARAAALSLGSRLAGGVTAL